MTRLATVGCALLLLSSSLLAQAWLASPRYLAEADVAGVDLRAHGDLDGDGDTDLVGFTQFNTAYQVFLNEGGEFTAGAVVPLPVSATMRVLAGPLQDVTDDGHVDLLVSYAVSGYKLVLYPGAGDGTFGAPLLVSLEGWVQDHVLAQVSGGPGYEIGLANKATGGGESDDTLVRWWSWDGVTLVPSASVFIEQTTPLDGVETLTAIDHDGDTVPDLVVGSRYQPWIRVLPTVAGAPTNTLPAVTVSVASTSGLRVFAGDLDLDGDDDVLVAGRTIVGGGGETQRVRAVLFEGGVASLGPITVLSGFDSYGIEDLYLADWDGDGDVDLLSHSGGENPGVSQYCYLGIFENDGTQRYTFGSRYRTDEPGTAAGLADVDGDGIDDFVAPRAIVFGRHDGVAWPLRSYFSFTTSPAPGLLMPDLQQDGDVDLVGADGLMLPSDGLGHFSSEFADTLDPWPEPAGTPFFEKAVAAGDFTGDGRTDFLVRQLTIIFISYVFDEMRLVADDGTGAYVDLKEATPGTEVFDRGLPGPALVADLDGDLDQDVVTDDGFWPNDGTGFFAVRVPAFAGEPRDVGDVEGDGDVDVLLVSGSTVSLLENQGGATLLSIPLGVVGAPSQYGGNLLDLDGDGDLDAAVGDRTSGAIHLFLNDGGGVFVPWSVAGDPEDVDVFGVDDVDGDGVDDLLAACWRGPINPPNDPKVLVLRCTDRRALAYEAPRAFVGGGTRDFVDVDQDGDLDAVGTMIVDNLREDGPAAGAIEQYGSGKAGSGGAVPVLGSTGPLQPGTTGATLHLRNGRGGAFGYVLVGTDRAALNGVFAGTLWVEPLVLIEPVILGGSPGVAGMGAFDVPLGGLVDAAAGLTLTLQVLVVDPGAFANVAHTGGLEMEFGY